MALEQPKKALTAYWIWLGEHREALQKELPGKKASEVSKLAGERWKALPETERKPFEERAEAAKAEYAKSLQDFKDQGGVVEKRRAKADADSGKKAKDENAPKKPVGGAFGCFLAERREDIKKSLPSDHKITDVTKKAGEMWKELEAKDKYEQLYTQKVEEYKAAMEEYRKAGGGSEEEQGEGSPKRKATLSSEEPAAKRAKAKAKGKAAPEAEEAIEINPQVLAAANKLGEPYEQRLKSLMAHPDIKAAGKSPEDVLAALKSSKGLVHPARRALLGA